MASKKYQLKKTQKKDIQKQQKRKTKNDEESMPRQYRRSQRC